MEKLPPELLIEIFNYLGQKDIENSSKVCIKWHQTISNTNSIMDQLFFYMRHNIQSAEDHHNLPFKRCNIYFDDCRIPRKELRFSFAFVDFLSNLTHLCVTLYADFKIEEFDDGALRVRLPNLIRLEIDFYSHEFLKVIKAHKIEYFIYNHDGSNYLSREPFCAIIKDFFGTCTKLSHLMIEGGFPEFDMSNYNFKLKCLEIHQFESLHSNFVDFLKAQKNSLEEIIFEVCIVSSKILNLIFFETNLKKFCTLHWNRFLLEEKINKSIELLVLSPKNLSLQKQAVISCGALKMLFVEWNWNFKLRDVLQLASSSLSRVKVVELKFPEIKHLKKILSWIRLNGYHLSLLCNSQSWCKKFFDTGSQNLCSCDVSLLVAISKENLNYVHQLGKVINIQNYIQITKRERCPGSFKFRNLTMVKQKRKSKNLPQARVYFEQIVYRKKQIDKNWEYGDYHCSYVSHGWDEDDISHLLSDIDA